MTIFFGVLAILFLGLNFLFLFMNPGLVICGINLLAALMCIGFEWAGYYLERMVKK